MEIRVILDEVSKQLDMDLLIDGESIFSVLKTGTILVDDPEAKHYNDYLECSISHSEFQDKDDGLYKVLYLKVRE